MTGDTPIDTGERLTLLPFEIISEIAETASNHGYRHNGGISNGWHFFRSQDRIPGEIAIARTASHWLLSVSHPGAAGELEASGASPPAKGGVRAFAFADQTQLRAAVSRVYQLSSALPSFPLNEYLEATKGLGDTEIERLAKQRRGQDIFRAALLSYWDNKCPITGISHPELLKASHIIPWAKCQTDAERLNVHNGLLLASHWDSAFDAGLVTFSDDGSAILSKNLSGEAVDILMRGARLPIVLSEDHQQRLDWHRTNLFREA